ncbi:MAG: ABC transporter [Pseudopedobacter saltans]|uniref:ABC transporter n=1 Tax=Pseudopedobacter saltans TaxID=151895 RepID=A0A2W5F6X0_9SPHI|nr:MAG: ABC transporter [Pseudopedobacter saltans]
MLVFNSFLKKYGSTTILDIPSFLLEDGLYWLKAENGAGKSTLLQSVSGILPFDGSVLLDDIDLHKNKTFQRKAINYAEAEPKFPSFLTGKELIDFFNETKKGDLKASMDLAKSLQIDHALPQKISTYSSGMLKKLSLILVFIGNPKWIFLDEPLITLDVEAVQTIIEKIEAFFAKGTSFIITSHQTFSINIPIQNLTIENKTIIRN